MKTKQEFKTLFAEVAQTNRWTIRRQLILLSRFILPRLDNEKAKAVLNIQGDNLTSAMLELIAEVAAGDERIGREFVSFVEERKAMTAAVLSEETEKFLSRLADDADVDEDDDELEVEDDEDVEDEDEDEDEEDFEDDEDDLEDDEDDLVVEDDDEEEALDEGNPVGKSRLAIDNSDW